jgi:molybdopterin/thiamine biosynthesis adenylyltransferase/rhodanese-related sulfurtransferase
MPLPSIIDPSRSAKQEFSNDEIARYSRHLIMPEVTLEGQKRLKAASILCIGAGGLGSPILLYLAAAGIGRIGIVDSDVVDFSNLQRQVVHGTKDMGRSKCKSARERIRDINPNVQVDLYETLFTSENARKIAEPYDIIIDGTDNFQTRYLTNDLCFLTKKVNVYGSIFRFDGQATVFAPHLGGPCYRCMFPEPPPPGEVLGVLPGVIGVIQAIEAVKLICGIGDPLMGRLVNFDALAMRFREFKLRKDPKCPLCGPNPTVTDLIDYDQFCGIPQQRAQQAEEARVPHVTVEDLKAKLESAAKFRFIDVREPYERDICGLREATLVPMAQLPARMSEFDSAEDTILICKNGARSAHAVKMLQEAGFTRVWNVEKGFEAWAERIDTSFPKY